MGLGKTITSLAKVEQTTHKKLLIICLVGKIDDWAEEVKLLHKPVKLNKGTKKNKKLLGTSTCHIISFQSSWRLKELLEWVDKDTFIIIDESQRVKNKSSNQTKFAMKLGERTTMKLLLSGNPTPKGYEDLYSQLYIMGVRMPYKEFADKFLIVTKIDYGTGWRVPTVTGYKNTDELQCILNDVAVFLKTEDAIDLPDTNFITIKCKKGKEYDKFIKDEGIDGFKTDNLKLRLRQLSNGFIGNREEYMDYGSDKDTKLEELIDSTNRRVVVFYNFVPEYVKIKKVVEKLDRPYSTFNGQEKDLKIFNSKENAILIAQYASGSTGLNLQKSNIVIFYAPTDNADYYYQAVKRIHRIGQKNKCTYYKLVTSGTVEPYVYQALDKKRDYTDQLFEKYLEEVNENVKSKQRGSISNETSRKSRRRRR